MGVPRAATRHVEDVGELAVAAHVGGDHAVPPPRCRRIAAPAPSPKSTQVLRSFQSMIVRELFRADDEDGVVGVRGDELLRDLERVKESGAGRGDVETRRVRRADLGLHEAGGAGNTMSGVTVATMMRSISSAVMPACSIAASAAFAAMSLVYSSFAAMRRSLMPVRVVIHSSLVSTILREIVVGQALVSGT